MLRGRAGNYPQKNAAANARLIFTFLMPLTKSPGAHVDDDMYSGAGESDVEAATPGEPASGHEKGEMFSRIIYDPAKDEGNDGQQQGDDEAN